MKRLFLMTLAVVMLVSIGGCLIGLEGNGERGRGGAHDRDGGRDRGGDNTRDQRHDERR